MFRLFLYKKRTCWWGISCFSIMAPLLSSGTKNQSHRLTRSLQSKAGSAAHPSSCQSSLCTQGRALHAGGLLARAQGACTLPSALLMLPSCSPRTSHATCHGWGCLPGCRRAQGKGRQRNGWKFRLQTCFAYHPGSRALISTGTIQFRGGARIK